MKVEEEENINRTTIEIPLKDSDEVIELHSDQLPDADEVLEILKGENAFLHIWISLALEYYKLDKIADFLKILECSRVQSNVVYEDFDKDKMRVLDILAAYYVREANREKNKDKKKELITKAKILYNEADKIIMYDQDHLIGRAYFSLLEGEVDHADTQFNFVLNQCPDNIPSILGKANISYHKKDYRSALAFYRKALRTNPKCPASVRVGMAHCFLKLNNEEKAKIAFERALQLDPDCIGALIGLGVMIANEKGPENVQKGMNQISHAYNIDPSNPMVLNHLSDHYFFKKDCKVVQQFALHAFHSTENEAMRAESCYHLAKSYHSQKDYDQAFQYYYQSTQCAPSNFVLPHYGLGQMYLHRGDTENASSCFEKVLKSVPDNYEAMKILSSLYTNSGCAEKMELAKDYLQKLTERFPQDIEAWIEYAQILETNHCSAALTAYETAFRLLKDLTEMIPPEILNNLGVCHYRLGNMEESQALFEKSLESAENFCDIDSDYYTGISVTVTYNLARLQESLGHFDRAEQLYKQISKEYPKYIDCYVRLGCMARSKGQMSEASDWFREVLNFNTEDPDGWCLLANLFMAQTAYGAAQKKFEKILTFEGSKEDHYAIVALGNVWLQTLHQNIPLERRAIHENRALACFKQVLRWEPKNIWAANGIGAVLAHKGYLIEAREIFGEVREATSDFCDVWLNIAHIYIEQGQYMSAIHMYENCIRKFHKSYDVELLQYLARAYFKAGKFEESKRALLRARRIAPLDNVLLFNIALVLQRLAISILEDEMSDLIRVLKATEDLELALKFFKYIADGDKIVIGVRIVMSAQTEVQKCNDLIAQTGYHIARAKNIDEEEKLKLKKQEEERRELEHRQREEERKLEEERQKTEQENKKKRQRCVEKVKNILMAEKTELENSEEKPVKKSKTDIDSGTDLMEEEPSEVKAKTKRGRKKKSTNDESNKRAKKSRTERSKSKVPKRVRIFEKEKVQCLSKDIISSSESERDEPPETPVGRDVKMEIESERSSLSEEEGKSPRQFRSQSRSRSRSRSASVSAESAFSGTKSGSSRSASLESHKSNSSNGSKEHFQSVKIESEEVTSLQTS